MINCRAGVRPGPGVDSSKGRRGCRRDRDDGVDSVMIISMIIWTEIWLECVKQRALKGICSSDRLKSDGPGRNSIRVNSFRFPV